jgi:hypothetical protein
VKLPAARALRLACVVLVASPAELHAEPANAPSRLGDTAWALPGFVRVGVPGLELRRIAVAGSAGYGMTEGQSSTDGAHHRFFGSAAAGVAPVSALELSLRFDGRYDLHPDDGRGAHGGAVGDPRFLARYGVGVGDALRFGLEAAAWFPGKDAPSLSLDATTVDAKALAAWAPAAGPILGIAAGFRFDQSAKAAPARDRIRSGDRLSLGLSDFNAVLVGVGVAVPVGKTEFLGEASTDLLIGAGAPSLGKSPTRITAGVRHHLNDAFALEALAEASPSGRPSLAPTAPLVPVEPRFSLMLGLRYRLPFDSARPPPEAAAETTPSPAAVAAVMEAKTAALVIHVVGEDGAVTKEATINVQSGETSLPASSSGDGAYRVDGVPLGPAKIAVAAEGFTAEEQSIDVGPDSAKTPIEIRLKALAVSGQLRGLIRSFSGKGLPATIHVDPVGTEVKADAQGAFTIDVAPGDYELTIRASRFKEQHRKVHVEPNGVTVINAELTEGK